MLENILYIFKDFSSSLLHSLLFSLTHVSSTCSICLPMIIFQSFIQCQPASVNLFCSFPPFLLVRGSIINNAWLCNTLTEQISQQVAVIVVRGPAGITQHCVWSCLIMKVPDRALLPSHQQLSQRLPCSHEIRSLYNAC